MPEFSWYAVVSPTEPLEQGDLLNLFPVLIPDLTLVDAGQQPTGTEVNVTARVEFFDVVVMTQSCDFLKLREVEPVVLCPRYSYREAKQKELRLKGKDGWNKLINGTIIEIHLLNLCNLEHHPFDYQVVDLKMIFSAPFAFVKQFAVNQGEHVRLLPPYREHLAQAFARRFMRVGLPIDLPREYPYP